MEEQGRRVLQGQLDTRALEIASQLRGTMDQIEKTLRDHMQDCGEERRIASQGRQKLRDDIVKAVNSNTRLTIGGLAALVLILLGIIGYLIDNAGWPGIGP